MRVNSAFTGFFTNRLAAGPGLAIVLMAVFLIVSSYSEHPVRDLRAKQMNLFIRQIGDRLLLQAGDSTSRVLPVTEVKEGTFLLKFENDFVFNHDSLIALSLGMLPKTKFPSGYTVTVQDCTKGEIVYGFQVNNDSPDILACRGRIQPSGCYAIEFVFPDLYENAKQKKAGIGQLTKPVKADRQEVDPKPETLTTTIDQRAEEFQSVKVDSRDVNSESEALKTTTFGYPSINMVYVGMLALLGVGLLIWRFGKIVKPEPSQNQIHTRIIESVPEWPALGKFLFDTKGHRLLLGSEEISLTDKEFKVLELLHKNFGELIPRDTLMQEVWINEGVITGRSLDMFVSKLRKKLSRDPELRITNIPGKGYKLEIPEEQIG